MVLVKSDGRHEKALVGQQVQQQLDFASCSQTIKQEYKVPGRAFGGVFFLPHTARYRLVEFIIPRMVETGKWK